MSRFPKDLPVVIEPALRAARDVLHDLEPDDVPAALRRVVAHSGPRLTPPLAAKLIAELDRLEWLRADAAERLDETASPAAKVFLAREDGWWPVVADALAESRVAAGAGDLRSLEQELAKRSAALDAAKTKLKREKLEAKQQVQALRAEVKELKRRELGDRRAEDREFAGLEERIAQLEHETDELRADLRDADASIGDLGSRVREQRRLLADAHRQLEAGGSRWGSRDPLARARELDLAAAAVPRHQDVGVEQTAVRADAADRLLLPQGIRPDRGEAVDWLLTQPRLTVLVDGYNLLFHLEPGEFTTGKARRRLSDTMAHFVRKAKGSPQVIIVFDSTLPGSRDALSAGSGVSVRFAEPHLLADEEVVALAASTPQPVVVVSSDREVREDSARNGALVLWSEAFVDWVS